MVLATQPWQAQCFCFFHLLSSDDAATPLSKHDCTQDTAKYFMELSEIVKNYEVALFCHSNYEGDGQQQQTTTLCRSVILEGTGGLWLANTGKKKMIGKKISSGLWGNFLGTNQLGVV